MSAINSKRPVVTKVAKLIYDPSIPASTTTIKHTTNNSKINRLNKNPLEHESNQKKENKDKLKAVPPSEPNKNFDNFNFSPRLDIPSENSSSKAISDARKSKTDLNFKSARHDKTAEKSELSNPSLKRSKSYSTLPISALASNKSNQSDEKSSSYRKKSYNPEEARQYIKEQKLKRKSLNAAGTAQNKNISNQIDREQIQKRLLELKKTTQIILKKNIKKAKKRCESDKKLVNDNFCINQKGKSDLLEKLSIQKSKQIKESDPDKIEKEDKASARRNSTRSLKLSKSKENSEKMCNDAVKSLNTRKVGLLRRNSDINLNNFDITDNELHKELPISALIGEQQNKLFPSFSDEKNFSSHQNIAENLNIAADTEQLSSQKRLENSQRNEEIKQQKTVKKSIENDDLKLLIPETSLKCKTVPFEEKSIQVDSEMLQQEKPTKPPSYWLKSTPIQIYPYNFIMAVRKKLEAITAMETGVTKLQQQHSSKKLQSSSAAVPSFDLSPIIKPINVDNSQKIFTNCTNINNNNNSDRNSIKYNSLSFNSLSSSTSAAIKSSLASNKIKNHSNKIPDDIESLKENIYLNKAKTNNNSDSISELLSNFSSITVNIPKSPPQLSLFDHQTPTMSEISSIKSDSLIISPPSFNNHKHKNNNLNNHDDDTTMSSSVFSSPEKRRNQQQSKNQCKDLTFDVCHKIYQQQNNIRTVQITHDGNRNENADDLIVPPITLKRQNNAANVEKSSSGDDIAIYSTKNSKNDLSSTDYSLKSISTKCNYAKTAATNDLNFEQFLEDFNKSLSQVIEANEQLKTSLHKRTSSINLDEFKTTKPIDNFKPKLDAYSSHFEQIEGTPSKSQANDKTMKKTLTTSTSSTITTRIYSNESLSKSSVNTITDNNYQLSADIELKSSPSITHNQNIRSNNGNDKISHSLLGDHQSIDDDKSQMKNFSLSSEKALTSTEIEIVIEEELSRDDDIPLNDCDHNKFSSVRESFDNDNHNLTVIPRTSDYFQTHINTTRGNFPSSKKHYHDINSDIPPPEYSTIESSMKLFHAKNSTNSSIITATTTAEQNCDTIEDGLRSSQSTDDKELSMISFLDNFSETTLNYSTIGLYEQLLKTEATKSEYLSAMLKIREKALIDRTRGQIAWLEVQKEKCKGKGLTIEISTLKKRQRALLLKMEKEKEEIKRFIKLQNDKPERTIRKNLPPKLSENIINVTFKKSISHRNNHSRNDIGAGGNIAGAGNSTMIRGYELEVSHNLEIILRKREEELKKRRAHVKNLLEWHQRLDREEKEIYEVEKMLFNCNNYQINTENHSKSLSLYSDEIYTQQMKINEINKSLKELQNIPDDSGGRKTTMNDNDKLITKREYEYVHASGRRLNQLWKNLTGRTENKFESQRYYKLNRRNIEKLYQKAKEVVLNDFGHNDDIRTFLEQSASSFKCDSNDGKEGGTTVTNRSSAVSVDNLSDRSVKSSSSRRQQQQQQKIPSTPQSKDTENPTPQLLDSSISEKTSQKTPAESANHSEQSIHTQSSIAVTEEFISVNDNENNVGNTSEIASVENNSECSVAEKITKSHEENESGSIKSAVFDLNTATSSDQVNAINDENANSNDGTQTITQQNRIYSEHFESSNATIATESITTANSSIKTDSQLSAIKSGQFEEDKSNDEFNLQNDNSHDVEVIKISQNDQQRPSVIVNSSSLNHNDNSNSTNSTSVNSKRNESTISNQSSLPSIEAVVSLQNQNFSDSSDYVNGNILSGKSQINECQSGDEAVKTDENISKNSLENQLIDIISHGPVDNDRKLNHTNDTTTGIGIEDYSSSSFENGAFDDDTMIKDISSPNFESTVTDDEGDSKFSQILNFDKNSGENYQNNAQQQQETTEYDENTTSSKNSSESSELKQRLIHIGESLMELHQSFERALSPEKSPVPKEQTEQFTKISSSFNDLKDLVDNSDENLLKEFSNLSSTATSIPVATTITLNSSTTIANTTTNAIRNYLAYSDQTPPPPPSSATTGLMPDIINEVELRRRQQIIENEIRQLEHEVPYVFLREIPNKPPPPYVPPAHGSPMTAIFPSEQRIQEIAFRRTQELYEEMIAENNENHQQSIDTILNENITNIYERIILDICKERIDQYKLLLKKSDISDNCKLPLLSLYNPPDRLKCIQKLIYKYIRKVLAMDKCKSTLFILNQKSYCYNTSSIYSEYDPRKKSCDQVDEILIQELHDDDEKWTNFDVEEIEIKQTVTDQIFDDILNDVMNDCIAAQHKQRNFNLTRR